MLCLMAPSQAAAEQSAKSGTGEGGDAYAEPAYVDTAPTLEDTAPTLQLVEAAEAGGSHSPAAAGAEGEPAPVVEATPPNAALAAEHCVIDITSQVPAEGEVEGESADTNAFMAELPPDRAAALTVLLAQAN